MNKHHTKKREKRLSTAEESRLSNKQRKAMQKSEYHRQWKRKV